MPATIGPINRQQTVTLAGGYFAYTNASTVTLTVSGLDGYCHVEVGTAISKRIVSFSANKTMNLTVAGPGGLHQDHAEANSTVYTIYLAWKSATDDVNGTADLFAVPSGTNITPAKLTTLGAGYDYVSKPIGFATNNAAGNIISFVHEHDWWTYSVESAPLINGLVFNVQTAIPLGAFVPVEAPYVELRYQTNTTINWGYFTFGPFSAGSIHFDIFALGLRIYTVCFAVDAALASMVFYKVEANPLNIGVSLYVNRVRLSTTDRE